MPDAKKYQNVLVNSATAKAASFPKADVQYGKRFVGVVVVPKADYKSTDTPTGRWDLKGNVQIGSAALIDYNYVLMALHTYESIKTYQDGKKALVIFNNEFTAATADGPKQQRKAETSRPFCYLRGDAEAYVGWDHDYHNEDFALVKIEWNSANDFGLIVNPTDEKLLPRFSKPGEKIEDKVNAQKELCYIQQFGPEKMVEADLWTHMSTNFVWGSLGLTNQQPANKSMSIYAYTFCKSRTGASGSPVYNTAREIVGIVEGPSLNHTFFLPLEHVYACTYKSTLKYYVGVGGKSAGDKLKEIYDYRSKLENWAARKPPTIP